MMRWSDHFSEIGRTARGVGHKTTKADVVAWEGYFEGQLLCIVSTIRLIGSNMAQFLVNSGARIGTNDWNLRGGHYVDLRVLSRQSLSSLALQRLADLARTEESRPVAIRQGKECLAEALRIPPPS